MLTSLKQFYLSSLMVFLLSAANSFSQDGNIMHIQTFDFQMPEDGSWSEFDSLTALINKNVVSKNDKILSQRIVRHLWGNDSRQLIMIREYAKIEDLVSDDDTGGELFRAAWKTPEERKAFNDAFNKYFRGSRHSDEIYQEFTGARK